MGVELAALVGELRDELTKATDAGKDSDIQFELGPIELELTVVVGKEAGPNAKVKFWVVEIGADAKLSTQSTQKIKLSLNPKDKRTPDRQALISGSSVDGER